MMKGRNNIILKKTIRLSPFLIAAMALMLSSFSIAHSGLNKCQRITTGDSIIIQKQKASRKHKIFLYTDAAQKTLFFGVKGDFGKVYQLFLFDLEGRLIKQSEIRNTQTSLIGNMEKGIYFFEVFTDDDRIENGQVIVR